MDEKEKVDPTTWSSGTLKPAIRLAKVMEDNYSKRMVGRINKQITGFNSRLKSANRLD